MSVLRFNSFNRFRLSVFSCVIATPLYAFSGSNALSAEESTKQLDQPDRIEKKLDEIIGLLREILSVARGAEVTQGELRRDSRNSDAAPEPQKPTVQGGLDNHARQNPQHDALQSPFKERDQKAVPSIFPSIVGTWRAKSSAQVLSINPYGDIQIGEVRARIAPTIASGANFVIEGRVKQNSFSCLSQITILTDVEIVVSSVDGQTPPCPAGNYQRLK